MGVSTIGALSDRRDRRRDLLQDRRIQDRGHSEQPEYILFAGWAGSELSDRHLHRDHRRGDISGARLDGDSGRHAERSILHPRRCRGSGHDVRAALARGGGEQLRRGVENPMYCGASIAMVISVAILSTALMRSDVEHRTEAVIDPLTGLLNRTALRNRTTSSHSARSTPPNPSA